MNQTLKFSLVAFLFFFFGSHPVVLAKKKKEVAPAAATATPSASQSRINSLSADEKLQFDALSDDQKKAILNGRVEYGFNEQMIKWAVGEPFYGTEHHPKFIDYEQVWYYTKPDVKEDVREERIIDRQTNWPTIHRTTTKKTCHVGDYFILFDRGVVEKVVPDTERKVHGSCTIETSEAYLPIVDGKPVEPKQK